MCITCVHFLNTVSNQKLWEYARSAYMYNISTSMLVLTYFCNDIPLVVEFARSFSFCFSISSLPTAQRRKIQICVNKVF